MIEIETAAESVCREIAERTGFDGNTAFVMKERGEVIGEALCCADPRGAQILYLRAPDTALTDALLRAALNAMLSEGIQSAVLSDLKLLSFAIKKGYCPCEAENTLKIADFFAKSVCKGL